MQEEVKPFTRNQLIVILIIYLSGCIFNYQQEKAEVVERNIRIRESEIAQCEQRNKRYSTNNDCSDSKLPWSYADKAEVIGVSSLSWFAVYCNNLSEIIEWMNHTEAKW